MPTYVKLFSQIIHSTIWRETNPTRILWIMMLALADRDGVVYGSIPGLADSAHITLEECEDAIQRFQEPDKYSSTKDHDGRRIIEVVGGWKLLNYSKYRELQSLEDVREKARIRVQNHRERKKKAGDVTLPSRNVTIVTPGNRSNDIASASASASASPVKPRSKSIETGGGFNSRVIEPNPPLVSKSETPSEKQTANGTPENLNEFQYAKSLMEKIGMVSTNHHLKVVSAAIKSVEKEQGGLASAYDFVLTVARREKELHGTPSAFWFSDKQKWESGTKDKYQRFLEKVNGNAKSVE